MAITLDKVPPQSIEAESAVLGAMLIEKDAVIKVLDIVKDTDFYKEVHKQVFIAARDLYLENQPVENITVAEKLKKSAMFAEAGGIAFLINLVNSVQTSANVEHYAQIVRNKSILRQLVNIGSTIATDAFNETDIPENLLDKSQQSLFDISISNTGGPQKVAGFVRDALKHLEKLSASKLEVSGLRTGFKDLDRKTAGLHPSELTILAARPGMGKTAFALNIAEHVAVNEKKPVAVFSLEMSAESLIMRFLASRAQVEAGKLRTGYFDQSSWSRLTSAAQLIAESPLHIDDTAGLSITELSTRARRLANDLKSKQTPLALIVIDYLQLMRGTKNNQDRQNEISEISRALKGLARNLKVPVIALSQLSRQTEQSGRKGNKPQLSDLRDSGAIEQDADVVQFIYREGYYDKDDPDKEKLATLMIAKQRNGPLGDVDLIFEGKFTRFYDSAPRIKDEN
jgi:replicative DNA helicase